MRKLFRDIMICSIVLCASAIHVSAKITTLDYDGGNTPFVLSGVTDIDKAGQNVTVKIVNHGGEILYAQQIRTERSGQYSFQFELDDYGDAIANISEEGVLQTPVNLYKSTSNEIENALRRLNSGEGIVSIVTDENDTITPKVLQLNSAKLNSLNESGLYAKVIDEKETYSTLPEFLDYCKVAEFLVSCETASAAELLIAMEEYADYLHFTEKNALTVFESCGNEEKVQLLSGVCGKPYTNIEAFCNKLYDHVITKKINEKTNYNEKYSFAGKNNDFIGLDLDAYEKLGDLYDEFKKEAFANSFNDVNDIKKKCKEVYDKYKAYAGGDRGSESSPESSKNVSVTGLSDKEETSPSTIAFNDLEQYEWARESILALAQKGVINGKGNGIFAPGDLVTRAEFTKILVGALQIEGSGTGPEFSDVSRSHWAYPYVLSAFNTGIVKGISNQWFGANENLKREDMAVLCLRAIEYKKAWSETDNNEVTFADEGQISEYAKDAVKKLSKAGIINGKGNNCFDPDAALTRAEAAKVIYSLMGR